MTQGVSGCRPRAFKKRKHHLGCDIGNACWLPLGCMVFVHRQGTNALYRFAADTTTRQMIGLKTMTHQIALHAQIFSQCHVAATANLLRQASMLNFFSVSMSSLDMPMAVAPRASNCGVASANW